MTMPLRSSGRLRAAALLSVGLVVVAASILTVGAASAAEPTTTYCSQNQPLTGPVTGNLVVRAHRLCDLNYDVAGNAVVETGSQLTGSAGVAGNLRLDPDSLADFYDSPGVGGYVVLDHAVGVGLYSSNVGGSVIGSLEAGGGVFLVDSAVLGRLAVSGIGPYGLVSADGLRVAGGVVLDGVQAVLLGGVTVGRSLVLRHVHNGYPVYSPGGVRFTDSVVCGGRVRDDVTVEDATGKVEIGAGAVCRAQQERLTTGGSFLAYDNTASAFVGGEIGGDAVCRDNLHHPRGDGTTTGFTALKVDGRRLGQCARLPRP